MLHLLLTHLLPPALACCGMDQCPTDPGEGRFTTRLYSRSTWVPDTHGEALVLESFASAGVRVGPLTAQLNVPGVWLHTHHADRVGLGNLVAVADLAAPGERPLGLGLQVEAPTATDEALGGAHWMLLPYARGQLQRGRLDALARVGWAQALGHEPPTYEAPVEGAHSHDTPALVNPHTEQELITRVELGFTQPTPAGALRLGLRGDGIQTFEDSPQTLLTAGPVLALSTPRAQVLLHADLPLTADRRLDARVGLSLSRTWGTATQGAAPGTSATLP